MRIDKKQRQAREKILNTARDLFYRQGYIATGFNQVIAESGVSKNTFYYYFPSKDDLCVAYLQEMDNVGIGLLKDKINSYKTPYEQLMAPLEFVKEWNNKHNFRGCPFLNITTEVTDITTNIRKEVIYNKDGFRSIIRELVKDLKNSDDKYSSIDVLFVTDAYYVIVEGAIVACQSYGDAWPYDIAKKNLENLLNP